MRLDVNEVPEALKLLRVQRDLSPRECARLSGFAQEVIGSWERGEGLPSLPSLMTLLAALDRDFGNLQNALDRLRRLNGPLEQRWSRQRGKQPRVFGEWSDRDDG
jgi:transcriptional regulator with XRE-family HTH domain